MIFFVSYFRRFFKNSLKDGAFVFFVFGRLVCCAVAAGFESGNDKAFGAVGGKSFEKRDSFSESLFLFGCGGGRGGGYCGGGWVWACGGVVQGDPQAFFDIF